MTVWIDAQMSPGIAAWIESRLAVEVVPVRDLGLGVAKDIQIFLAAREADAIVLTKDADFVHLLLRHGPPPRVLWLTCGNTSNANLKTILIRALPEAMALLEGGESLVQIAGPMGHRT